MFISLMGMYGTCPYVASDSRAGARSDARSAGSRAGSARHSEPLTWRAAPTRCGSRAGGCSSGPPPSPSDGEDLAPSSPPLPAHVRAAARLRRHPLSVPSAVDGHAGQFGLPLRGTVALHGPRDIRLHHEVDDALAELAVGRIGRCRQRLGDLGPGLQRIRTRGSKRRPRLVLTALLADSGRGTGLALPRVVSTFANFKLAGSVAESATGPELLQHSIQPAEQIVVVRSCGSS